MKNGRVCVLGRVCAAGPREILMSTCMCSLRGHGELQTRVETSGRVMLRQTERTNSTDGTGRDYALYGNSRRVSARRGLRADWPLRSAVLYTTCVVRQASRAEPEAFQPGGLGATNCTPSAFRLAPARAAAGGTRRDATGAASAEAASCAASFVLSIIYPARSRGSRSPASRIYDDPDRPAAATAPEL